MASTHSKVAGWQHDLLPHVVDRVARESPDNSYGLWPVSPTTYDEGFTTITYSQLANIVDGLSWFLTDKLGPGHGEVITYSGPNDVRLTALLLAAIKTNYVLFFSSPRNSAAAHKGLLEALECKTLITPEPVPPYARVMLEAAPLQKLTIPEIDELLGKTYEHFKCDRTYEKNAKEPIWAIHTSGSTGLPKPIVWTSEAMARHHNGTDVPPPDGMRSLDHFERGKMVFTTLPPFHGAGLGQFLFWGIPFGSTPISPLAMAIPTAQGLVEALKKAPAEVAMVVPSIVAELAQDPASLEYVAANLKLLVYLGGDLPQALGDVVAAKMPLRCQWGCSEIGFVHQLWPTELGPLDWQYIRLHPSTGAVFEETVDEVYELVFKRQDSLRDVQSMWSIKGQEHLDEYRTKDLWEPHPTVPDAWRWRARTDDIVVFLNGEKTNPVTMEQHVAASNPEVTGALVVGAQRFQAALIIEPASTVQIASTADRAALIERIWPSIEEANSLAPAHARVEKSMVLIGDLDRPLIRAPKGTIQRRASIAQYSAELDKLYADADADVDADVADEFHSPLSKDTITQRIREIVLATTGWKEIEDSSGFFDNGMDSLQALRIVRALRRGLGNSQLALSTLYHNPSITQLAAVVAAPKSREGDSTLLQSLHSTYSGLLQQITPAAAAETTDVILTGSTGTVGTYVLRALLDRPGIGHVFCLNRGSDGGCAAQATRFEAAGFEGDLLNDRVTFLQCDLAQPLLGLDEANYEKLQSRVGLIIHNAWPVNFNLDLLAFRPQLAGLVNLFALSNAASSRGKKVKFLFVSSVGVVLDGKSGAAPEALVEMQQHESGNGYTKSKLIAEHLCDAASRHLGTSVVVARVGQVAGAVKGRGLWNPAEWLPSLVMSSRHLGCLPNDLGPRFSAVDWVPVDALADVLVDLVTQDGAPATEGGAGVFNIRNPAVATWSDVLPAIKDGIEAEEPSRTVEVVTPETWMTKLEKSVESSTAAADADGAKANPAIKLIEFYKNSVWTGDAQPAGSEALSSQAPMAIDKTFATSPTLRDLPPVSASLMRKWVDEWLASAAAGN